jgi:hypothetical protein
VAEIVTPVGILQAIDHLRFVEQHDEMLGEIADRIDAIFDFAEPD